MDQRLKILRLQIATDSQFFLLLCHRHNLFVRGKKTVPLGISLLLGFQQRRRTCPISALGHERQE